MVRCAALLALVFAGLGSVCGPGCGSTARSSGNPILPGTYADPEGAVFEGRYWVYPTASLLYEQQTFLDCFSSPDLVEWSRHEKILDTSRVAWAKFAMWAPAIALHKGRYYLFFAANDIQNNEQLGGIGVAVADRPEGPFTDHLGKPLIDRFHNGAQPIDQAFFRDADGECYLIYGGWRHCNIVRLNDDFTGLVPFEDGTLFREMTPEGYVEGPFMFVRNGTYYFMWSEGGWTGPDYRVAYAVGDSVHGPFRRVGTILQQDAAVATGAGHHSVIQRPGREEYFILYHRRPMGSKERDNRVVCIERLEFDAEGLIKPVTITFEGVRAAPIGER